ncbi:MAG: HEAT repeat domain-containing protein, partial [Planctomycetota bacterium]
MKGPAVAESCGGLPAQLVCALSRPIRLGRWLSVRAAIGLALACSPATFAGEQKPFEELLEELLPGVGAEDIASRREPQQTLQDACFQLGTPGREAERVEACRLMAETLGPETAKPARIWLLRQLEFIGGDECIDAVAAVLDDADLEVRDGARRALENNPSPKANAALLARLLATEDAVSRVALINALGNRGDPAGVDALGAWLHHADDTVAAAAANALGKIGGRNAAKLLDEARGGKPPRLRAKIADALLRCADRFLEEGDVERAAGVYRALRSPNEARPIRIAAMQGALNAAGDAAASGVLELLASDDADARAVAAGHVTRLDGDTAMELL